MPTQEKVFEESFSRVIGPGLGISDEGHDFFMAFYDRFLAKSPEVAKLFAHTDMKRQAGMLQKSVFHLAGFYATHEPTEYIYRIAHQHGGQVLDVRPELFDLWLDALVETVADRDPAFSPDVELGWRVAFAPGIALMKHYHGNPIPPATDPGQA